MANPNDMRTGPSPRSSPSGLRAFLTDSFIYGLGGVIDKAVGFLLLPLATFYLTPADYGLLSLFGTTLYLVNLLFSGGLHVALVRWAANEESPSVFPKVLFLFFLQGAGATLTLYLLHSILNRWVFVPSLDLVTLLVAIAWLTTGRDLSNSFLQARGFARDYLFFALIATIFTRGIGLGGLLLGYGLAGWMAGEYIGLLVLVSILSWRLRGEWQTPLVGSPTLGRLSATGWILVPAMFAHWVIVGSDKYLIRWLADDGLNALGLYGLAERVSGLLQLVNLSFMIAWRRLAMTQDSTHDGADTVNDGLLLYIAVAGYVALGFALFAPDLVLLGFDEQFAAGAYLVPPLALAAVLTGFSEMLAVLFLRIDRPALMSLFSVTVAVTSVTLNLGLIPRLGIQGAALTNIVSQVVGLLFTALMLRRYFPFSVHYRKVSLLVVGYILLYFSLFMLLPRSTWLALGLKGLTWFVLPMLLLALSNRGRDQLTKLYRLLMGRHRRLLD